MNSLGATITVNGEDYTGTLSIEVEQIDVTREGKTVPDMGWEYTDVRGHFHAWSDEETLPTLDGRSEHVDCDFGHSDDECEGYDVTVYSCKICGEIIEPKTHYIPSTYREFAPGRMSWNVELPGVTLLHGQLVSVLVRAIGYTAFGIGQVVDDGHPRNSFDAYGTARLVGAGELGQRKAVEVPA